MGYTYLFVAEACFHQHGGCFHPCGGSGFPSGGSNFLAGASNFGARGAPGVACFCKGNSLSFTTERPARHRTVNYSEPPINTGIPSGGFFFSKTTDYTDLTDFDTSPSQVLGNLKDSVIRHHQMAEWGTASFKS